MDKILEGVKVVELSTYAAAPAAGRVLADFGATVIKVESLYGDPFRNFGLSVKTPVDELENPCFQLENANKKGITLNLKSDEGKEILYKLLADANIFLTNTRMDALQKLKITYEDLQDKFPHLIYGHISGFGLQGEEASLPGYDITAFWARGGALLDLGPKGTGPITTPYAIGDHASTLALCTGLLGALYRQAKTGKGEKVLVSLFGTAIWINALMTVPCQYGDEFPKSRLHPLTPISASYCCKDENWLTLTILDYARDWPKFCKVIGRDDLICNEKYSCADEAKKFSEELVPLIAEAFKQQDREYWIELLTQYDLPFAKTQHMVEVIKDSMAWENGYLVDFSFENGNSAVIPCTPIQFKSNVAYKCERAPRLGEHTEEILADLGYNSEKINELVSKNVISKMTK